MSLLAIVFFGGGKVGVYNQWRKRKRDIGVCVGAGGGEERTRGEKERKRERLRGFSGMRIALLCRTTMLKSN